MAGESTRQYALRTARESDVGWLVSLRRQTMTPHFAAAGEELSDAQHRLRVLDNFHDIRIIAKQNRPIGMLKVVRAEDHWRIVQFQLLTECQGMGIGTAVLNELLADARRQRIPVTLNVLKVNPAHRLYARLGFVIDAASDDEYCMRFDPRIARDE